MRELRENLPAATWFDAIRDLGTVVISLVILNAVAYVYLLDRTPNLGYRIVREKWQLVETVSTSVDTLILGDSSCNQGVTPDVLSDKLGGGALNLCTLGDMLLVHDAWMLQRYLESHDPPRRVVLAHVYDVWHREVSHSTRVTFAIGPGLYRGSPEIRRSVLDDARVLLWRYVPLYSEPRSIVDALGAKALPTIQPDGFMPVAEPDHAALAEDLEAHHAFLKERGYAMSLANESALRRIVELAEMYGFLVYLVHAPVAGDLADNPRFRAYVAELSSNLERRASLSTRLHLVDADPWTFGPDQMQNVDHVTTMGARLYSERLASAIAELEGP